MTILVVNCGSSSIKFALYDKKKDVCHGSVQRVTNYKKTLKEIFAQLKKKGFGNITAVGHRVVHGGPNKKSVVVTKKILSELKKWSAFAPLHNPHNIAGIIAVQQLLPKVKNIAVFDTQFHAGIPEYAALYGLPLALSKKEHIRRYGFHGMSYQYVCDYLRSKKKLPKKLLVCHLGNGASVCAIKNGKSVDTSMGFSPLEGLMMGTRCGDIDAGAVLYLSTKYNNVEDVLQHTSGFVGVAGLQDVRDLTKRKDAKSKLALQMFCYRVQKYIGAYAAVLGGVDALVFTGGIGANEWHIRRDICKDLGFLGIRLDAAKNKKNVEKMNSGKVSVYAFKTNEEKIIVKEVMKLVK